MKLARTTELLGLHFGDLQSSLGAVRGAALTGLLALGAWSPAAQAIPVLSTAANIVVPANTNGIYINVVSGASGTAAATTGWDINPWGTTTLAFFNPTGASAVTGGAYVGGTSVTALTAGTVIGAASAYATSATTAVTFGAAAGNWALNATNYFGFRFIGDDALLHYGYGTIVVGATAAVRSVGQLWYESAAGTAITIPAVPEPANVALMLAGGAVIGAVLRRRRKAEAAA